MTARRGAERGFGEILSEEDRVERHYALYGETTPPPRGTGLTPTEALVRRAGVPRTGVERAVRHAERYGTSVLPPRGTGLGYGNPGVATVGVGTASVPWWGWLMIGVAAGGGVMYFLKWR